jgi:hypothetical protein
MSAVKKTEEIMLIRRSIIGRWTLAAMAFSLLFFTSAAFAQQPAPIRGEIEKVDGNTLSLKTRQGDDVKVKIADDARVGALVKASLADIKNDSFIGVAGIPQSDGTVQAFSVHIFLPAQRGKIPDGHRPWDERPDSTMTNAYVGSIVKAENGTTFTVKYKDGEKKISVTPQTVIAAVAPIDKSDIKAGAYVTIFASEKQPDGSVLVKSMYVGRNVKPAM